VHHPSFQLHTSSNTPSVPTNDVQGSFANSDEEMHFPSYNFCLEFKNWHNSRQGYNLGELINQLEVTRSLIFNTRNMAWFQIQEWSCLE
jgi:hypothetical protein